MKTILVACLVLAGCGGGGGSGAADYSRYVDSAGVDLVIKGRECRYQAAVATAGAGGVSIGDAIYSSFSQANIYNLCMAR